MAQAKKSLKKPNTNIKISKRKPKTYTIENLDYEMLMSFKNMIIARNEVVSGKLEKLNEIKLEIHQLSNREEIVSQIHYLEHYIKSLEQLLTEIYVATQ